MSDQLTYLIPSTTVVECDVCETENTVTYWDDLRNGRWEREAFTCTECATRHGEIDGNALDRGASTPVFAIRMAAYAFILIGVVAWDGWSVPLIVTGLAVLTGIRLITAFVNANRMVKEAPHE